MIWIARITVGLVGLFSSLMAVMALASPTRSIDVSMAKAVAGEAATFASGESLQVHGAIGYTYEQDLHVFMKRAWSLDLAFGTGA